jgi:uncharacterized protein (TIGR02996 family)
MPDEAAFLAAVCGHPDDDGPRLVYADWLDECGDPRGEFIRLQCRLAQLDEDAPERPPLEDRERTWLRRHAGSWRRQLPSPRGVSWQNRFYWPKFEEFLVCERGFPSCALCRTTATFLRHAPVLFAAVPLLELDFVGPARSLAALGGSPFLPRLTRLDLMGTPLSLAHVRGFLADPRLQRLADLDLASTALDTDLAAALAALPLIAELHSLNLAGNHIGDTGVNAILETAVPGRLRTLVVNGNELSPDWLIRWSHSPLVRELRIFSLGGNPVGDRGAQSLAAVTRARWRHLDLGNCGVSEAGFETLANSAALANLIELDMSLCRIGVGGVRALVNSPHLGQLQRLRLSLCQLPDEAGRCLADAPALDRVYYLDLARNDFSEATIDALKSRFGTALHGW